MKAYLVFDLRHGRFAAGVLDMISGKLRWTSEMIQVWQREGVLDPVDEADLCFFRPPREKDWLPISTTAISQLPDHYEKLTNLFEEPDERLGSFIKPALKPLLRPFLNDHKELEILFLVDSSRVAKHITGIAQILNRSHHIIVAPEDIDLLAGFAILDVEKKQLPKNGKIFTCTIDEELYSYRWNDGCFESVSSDGLSPESKWPTVSVLQRVGLIAFELIWSEYLIPASQAQLERIKEENDTLSSLLAKLNEFCTRLQGRSESQLIKLA
jgi:hypothetical protein